MKSILVLEDVEFRIKWLKDAFPEANVIWCQDVSSFVSTLRDITADDVALIILDHDLGSNDPESGGVCVALPGSWPLDKDGKTGSDAVKLLCKSDISQLWKNAPIIVWSLNTHYAEHMVSDLASDGYIATHIPFDRNSFRLRSAIASQL